MSALPTLALGPLGSPPGILMTLIAFAVVVLVGRIVLHVAWKLVVVGLAVVTTLWVLGALGFHVGVLGTVLT